jgi:hypothetical protein
VAANFNLQEPNTMNLFKRISLLALLTIGAISAQVNTLTQTSLSTAINASVQAFSVASATNITATPATVLYVDLEAMQVISVTGTSVFVQRGTLGTKATPHASAEMVLAGRPDQFFTFNQLGSCTVASTYVTPAVNIQNGAEWLCSSVTGIWGPGWQNSLEPATVTTAVASAAGLVTPSGPLFHITGTAAITGFNIPLGFAYGSFTVIPDAIFTTTTANNIGLASTAVVGKALTFTYDTNSSKFYPSY